MSPIASLAPERFWLRVLRAVVAPKVDIDALVQLAGLDAFVLDSLLATERCEPTPEALRQALESLNPTRLRTLLIEWMSRRLGRSGDERAFQEWHRESVESGVALSLSQMLPPAMASAAGVNMRWFALLGNAPHSIARQPHQRLQNLALGASETWQWLLREAQDIDTQGIDLADTDVAVRVVSSVRQRDPSVLQLNSSEWSNAVDAARVAHQRELAAFGLTTDFDAEAERQASERIDAVLALIGALSTKQAEMPAAVQGAGFVTVVGESLREYLPKATLFVVDSNGEYLFSPTATLSDLRVSTTNPTSALARAAREQRTQLMAMDGSAHSFVDRQVLHRLGERGLHVAPIVSDARTIGVLLSAVSGLDEMDVECGGMVLAPWLQLHNTLIRRDEDTRRVLSEKVTQHLREVVHEVNNPLAIVNNYVHILGRHLKERNDAQALQHLQHIEQETERAGGLLRELIKHDGHWLSGTDDVESLSRVVAGAVAALRPLAATRRIELNFVHHHDSEFSLPAATQIRQILTNLIRNAIEAVAAETGVVQVGIAALAYRDGIPHVGIAVADNGPGLPAGLLSQLGQPTQSAKGGVHQGVGLALAYRLTRQMQGGLDCESALTGTRFTLWVRKP